MANATYYAANQINDEAFGSTGFSYPTTYYLGVSTTSIQKDGTGVTEPIDGAYARVAILNNKTNFGTSSLGELSNLVEYAFDESTVNWGTVIDWFFADASTGGNVWWYGTLTNSRNVESATVLVLPIGEFTNTVE